MPKFEITLGAYRYEENTVEVEAETLEAAIAKAYQDDDGDYQPGDLGESFVAKILDDSGVMLPIPNEDRDPEEDPVRRAAPDLLNALRAAHDLHRALTEDGTFDRTSLNPDQINTAVDAVAAAIAKVEGRSDV